MFNHGEVGWPPNPPFRNPVFVVTHREREPWVREGGTIFYLVTDGLESAVNQARAAAGDKDVMISGEGQILRQALVAGLVDECDLHIVPMLLGGGVRLFDVTGAAKIDLEATRVVRSPNVTHVSYRVVK